MKKLVIVCVLAAVAVLIYLYGPKRHSKPSTDGIYHSGGVTFKVSPMKKLGVAASFLGTEVTHAEMLSKSPVLTELTANKVKVLTEAAVWIQQKNKSRQTEVELYMEEPAGAYSPVSSVKLKFSDQRPPSAVLKFDGKTYSRQELQLNQILYSQIETDIFEEKLRVAGDIYSKFLLLKAAKENNTTIQGYINKTILGLPLEPVTDAEIEDFARSRGIVLSKKDAALRKQLREIVKEQRTQAKVEAHIREKFPNETGEIYFQPPSLEIPVDEGMVILSSKKESAPTLLLVSNLTCNGCGRLPQILSRLRSEYKDKVRLGFINYFSENDWRSQLAAQAAICLNNQSYEAFWDFFVKMSQSGEVSEETINETARSTGVDYDEFRKCFVAQADKEEIKNQVKYAAELGVTVAPTVIFGSRVLTGNMDKQIESLFAEAAR